MMPDEIAGAIGDVVEAAIEGAGAEAATAANEAEAAAATAEQAARAAIALAETQAAETEIEALARTRAIVEGISTWRDEQSSRVAALETETAATRAEMVTISSQLTLLSDQLSSIQARLTEPAAEMTVTEVQPSSESAADESPVPKASRHWIRRASKQSS